MLPFLLRLCALLAALLEAVVRVADGHFVATPWVLSAAAAVAAVALAGLLDHRP